LLVLPVFPPRPPPAVDARPLKRKRPLLESPEGHEHTEPHRYSASSDYRDHMSTPMEYARSCTCPRLYNYQVVATVTSSVSTVSLVGSSLDAPNGGSSRFPSGEFLFRSQALQIAAPSSQVPGQSARFGTADGVRSAHAEPLRAGNSSGSRRSLPQRASRFKEPSVLSTNRALVASTDRRTYAERRSNGKAPRIGGSPLLH